MEAKPIDDHVLDATARILDRSGLAGLTLSAVADEAELSRVTLHRRGTTLDDLVIAVLGRASDDLRDSLWPVITAAGDAASRLVAALDILCEVAERHAGVLAAVYRAPARALPGQPGRTTSFEFIEPFERLLSDGAIDGSLVSEDPTGDATLLANSVAWTYLHMRQAHRWPSERTRTKVVALAVAHLLPR